MPRFGIVARRRRTLLTVVGTGILAATISVALLASCAEQPPKPPLKYHREHRPSVGLPNTVSVDLSRSLGTFPFAPGRQLSSAPNSYRYGPATFDKLDELDLDRVRVWLRFSDAYDVARRKQRYADEYDYLDAYSKRAKTLIVNWRSDYDPLVTKGTFSEAEFAMAQLDMMVDFKRRYPKIEYIEAENEPTDLAAYYPKYRAIYQVVNAVNAMRLPGPALKVGGPTLDVFSERRMGQFLDMYKKDSNPRKRLDFLSYHQYLITVDGAWHADKDNPAVVATERKRLDRLLGARGLPSLPVLVTETGAFPASRESTPKLGLDVDLHIQAACLASMHYYYLNQRDIVPLDWTIDHPGNDRKDMFANVDTGVPRPYYNEMLMSSMLPRTRFQATSDRLSPRGIGAYALAAADSSSIAVMTWNYQWTYQTAYDSRVVITNVPKEFRDTNLRVEWYKISSNVHSGNLQRVQSLVVGPRKNGTYYSETLPLRPNELRLLVLTPTKSPVTPAP